ncbi:unnamed protein product, partial [Ranitomeya imitator]
MNEELLLRLANGRTVPQKSLNIHKMSDTSIPLTDESSPTEVSSWLQAKGFNTLTVKSLGVLNGAQLFSLRKDEFRAVSPDEGARVYSQVMVQKALLERGSRRQAQPVIVIIHHFSYACVPFEDTFWVKSFIVKLLCFLFDPFWRDLKRAVHARQPRNLKELEAFCQEEWAALPSEKIKNLICNYHKRLQAVIDGKTLLSSLYFIEVTPIVTAGNTRSTNHN